jgi:ribosomal protein S27E
MIPTGPECIVRCTAVGPETAETDPTNKNYGIWQLAYEYFNKGLFNNQLPGCLITFQRQRNTYGFHAGSRFQTCDGNSKVDEIALNPSHFATFGPCEALSTLVHEMAHQRRWLLGNACHPGYHDKVWARMMIEVGLVPTDTGEPGGKATGRRVTHFIRPDGPFDRLCAELLGSGFVIPYVETDLAQQLDPTVNPDDPHAQESIELLKQKTEKLRKKKADSKTRYTCPGCDEPKHVWGKPGLHIICGECGARFEIDMVDEPPLGPAEL